MEPEPRHIKEEQIEPSPLQVQHTREEPEPPQATETRLEPEAINVDEAVGETEPLQNPDEQEPPQDVLAEPERPQIIDDLGELEYLDFDEYLDDTESPQIIDDLDEPELLGPEQGLEEPEPQNSTRKVEFWTRHDDQGLLLRKEFDNFVPRQKKSKSEEPVPDAEKPAGVHLAGMEQPERVRTEHSAR